MLARQFCNDTGRRNIRTAALFNNMLPNLHYKELDLLQQKKIVAIDAILCQYAPIAMK
jgi:hypothetical protein